MSDEQQQDKPNNDQNEPTRRDFVAMSIAAGIVAASGSASAADMPVTEKDVDIKAADGAEVRSEVVNTIHALAD